MKKELKDWFVPWLMTAREYNTRHPGQGLGTAGLCAIDVERESDSAL